MAAILKKLQAQGKGRRRPAPVKAEEQEENQITFRNVTRTEKNRQSIQTYKEEMNLPEFKITGVVFSVFSEENIDALSVYDVKNVNKSYNLKESTDDPRGGTIENNRLCPTCGKTNQDCVGHLGKIELPANIIHPFFRDITIMTLQTICFTCNRVLITEKIIKDQGINNLRGRKRMSAIADFCKRNIRCTNPKCGPRPIFIPMSSENETRYVWYKIKFGKKEELEYLTVETIKMKLNAISDKDARLLGFENNHPRNFIINFIPVIPLTSRPYIVREGEKRDDYLTSTYCDILNKKTESIQQEDFGKKEESYKDIIRFHNCMITGAEPCEQGFSKGGRKENKKAILERISRKDGLIRKHVMGKRVDFSGRSVIGDNGELCFNQVALPRLMKQITIPEVATKYNLEYLRQLSRQGEVSYFCPREGDQAGIKLKFNINKHTIQIGDKVGRFTQEDDIVLLNRQPTLHLQSMIGQRVRFQDKGSIGVHLSSTPGLNADFDGDESNIHFLQTTDARIEGLLLMSAKSTIVSKGDSQPQSVLVYNSVAGAYLLTGDDVILSPFEWEEGVKSMHNVKDYIERNMATLYSRVTSSTMELVSEDKYSGKLITSLLFPEDFWYKSGDVFISNGIIRSGRLTKKQVGGGHGSLVQSFCKWYGSEITSDFISAANFLFNWYIELSGLSIGIDDFLPEGLDEFKKFRDKEVRELNNRFIDLKSGGGNLDREKDIEIKQDMIKDTNNIIQKELIKIISTENNLSLMMKSGAKGDKTKIMHMIGFRGQINVGNTLPVRNITEGKRWLSTFSVNDNTVFATGLSGTGYIEGLEPNPFYAMAQEGRLNVIDRQLRTAETGYMQRRIIKAQEDLVASYDGAIYSQTGHIVQYSYGVGIAVDKMVQDYDDEENSFFSFIDTNELCGRVNTMNGFKKYNIGEEIFNIFNEVLSKRHTYQIDRSILNEIELGSVDDEFDDIEQDMTFEEEFDEDHYIDEHGDDDMGDMDFD